MSTTTTTEETEQKRREAHELENVIAAGFGVSPRPLPPRIRRDAPSVRFRRRDGIPERLRSFDQARAEIRAAGITFEDDGALAAALLGDGVKTAEGTYISVSANSRTAAYDV